MKTRIAAIGAVLAVALLATSLVLIGANYTGLYADLTRKPDRVPTPSYSPMPEAAPQPQEPVSEQQAEEEKAHAAQWLEWQRIIDECMADAGFEEYTYSERDMSAEPFPDSYTDEQFAAASFALGGSTGAGADYHWEDAGCAGGATHELGIGS